DHRGEGPRRGVQEFVDRRPHHEDDGVGLLQDGRPRRELEAPSGQVGAQQPICARLQKRHAPALDGGHLGLVGVVDAHPAAGVGVREPDEYEQGALPGAIHLPRGHLESKIEGQLPDRETPIIVHCASGVRSAFAAKTLQDLGYTDVASMAGGFNKWKDEGRPWSAPRTLSAEQRNRYQRHLLLPEVGEKGQQKLLDSRMLLLGAGGLGSPAALYLAAAGVGTLGIIDMDVVDESNLQRQILHNLDRIGERKVDSAKQTLTALNPDVNVVTYDVRLGADNILDIIDGYDVVVDGTDNFPTRFLVNDASVKLGI